MASTYTQCKLVNGRLTQTAWIPSRFARHGLAVTLRSERPAAGWVVREVWQTVPEDQVPDSYAERKAHKRATGDVQ